VLFLAVHEDAAAPGSRGLDARAEGNGAVEDVAGKDLLDLQVEIRRVGELERGEQRDDGAAVVAELHAHLDSTTTGPSRARSPSSMRLSVVRNPASGASIPSFCWISGTLKPTFHPTGSAPASRILARRISIASVPCSMLTASSRS
jgi:hypothetical protein